MERVIFCNRVGDDAYHLMKDISGVRLKTQTFGFDTGGVDDILLYTATKVKETGHYVVDSNGKQLRPTGMHNIYTPN